MVGKIIRNCAIGMGVVVGYQVFSILTEDNPKVQVVKDNILRTGQDFVRNCGEVGRSVVDLFCGEDEEMAEKVVAPDFV
ncbi:MAG: hypothetical protein IKA80_07810 [Spirochaetaceae bacterium]|nr:hypothetical protein [Spirochaetaceae bacterium]MBR2362537.1 hypothetical protein [Spirochaetaceae bacterium]MBR2463303.1 hypothetical protein [Spirochaetaceae bacterium]